MPRRPNAFVVALVLGCALIIPTARPAAAQGQPVRINVILALSGAAAFIGIAEKQSLALVAGLVNKSGGIQGHPLAFDIVDDQSNPQVTVQLANALIAKKVPVIIGPTFTATCLAVGPLLAKTGPVDYCLSPSITPAAGSYQYSATVGTRDDAVALARYYRLRGWTKIALMTTTDASGQQFEQYFNDALALPENKSLTLVAREHWAPNDISVSAQAERIKTAAPQAVIAWSAGTPTGTMLRGMHDAGIAVPIACGNGNMIYAQLAQYKSFLPKELYFPGRRALVFEPNGPPALKAAQQQYFDAFKSIKVRPNIASTLSWDPAMLIVDGLRKLGPDATAGQLNGWIQHLKDWVGINGTYDFTNGSQRGLAIDDVIIDR
ncbi:MAG TPA: ABC transporter substrate-binding protein, partial [Candidatus Aquilonibacter sp.]